MQKGEEATYIVFKGFLRQPIITNSFHVRSAGLSLSAEGLADAWGSSLKAPSVHFEQRSKFRQQAAPYNVRLN